MEDQDKIRKLCAAQLTTSQANTLQRDAAIVELCD
jgi:hypothetical protein